MPEQLSGILIHTPGTPPWLHRPVKVSISSELYPEYFWLRNFLDCSGIQFFDSPPLCQHSQLVYLCLPTPNCAALVWLTGHHAMPAVTKCFLSNPYLGKQRISLGVVNILHMCFCSHTWFTFRQKGCIW